MKQFNIAYGLALYNLMKEYYFYYTFQGVYAENDIMNNLYNKMDNAVNPKLLQDTYMYIDKNQQLKYTNLTVFYNQFSYHSPNRIYYGIRSGRYDPGLF